MTTKSIDNIIKTIWNALMISCISMGSWPCWKREKKVNKENDACAMTNVLEVEKKS